MTHDSHTHNSKDVEDQIFRGKLVFLFISSTEMQTWSAQGKPFFSFPIFYYSEFLFTSSSFVSQPKHSILCNQNEALHSSHRDVSWWCVIMGFIPSEGLLTSGCSSESLSPDMSIQSQGLHINNRRGFCIAAWPDFQSCQGMAVQAVDGLMQDRFLCWLKKYKSFISVHNGVIH